MRRSVTVLATLAMICLLRVPDVLAGAGAFGGPIDKTVAPTLNVSVVMDATPAPDQDPSEEGTLRQFAMTIQKGLHSRAAMFTGNLPYVYGCQHGGYDDLQASTEARFRRLMQDWAPIEVLDALILGIGDRDRALPEFAAIVDIDRVACTTFGSQQYLSFTGLIRFAK